MWGSIPSKYRCHQLFLPLDMCKSKVLVPLYSSLRFSTPFSFGTQQTMPLWCGRRLETCNKGTMFTSLKKNTIRKNSLRLHTSNPSNFVSFPFSAPFACRVYSLSSLKTKHPPSESTPSSSDYNSPTPPPPTPSQSHSPYTPQTASYDATYYTD